MQSTFVQPESGTYGYNNPKVLKKNMTLNLADPSSNLKPHLRNKNADILTSPDAGLLKLASPELEQLIIQSGNWLITTTPTLTQCLCPKNVTDEQQGFAEGFVRALTKLHNQNTMPSVTSAAQPANTGMAPVSSMAGNNSFNADLHSEPPVYVNLSSFNPSALNTVPSYNANNLGFPPQHQLNPQMLVQHPRLRLSQKCQERFLPCPLLTWNPTRRSR